jgi:hypothetical protein
MSIFGVETASSSEKLVTIYQTTCSPFSNGIQMDCSSAQSDLISLMCPPSLLSFQKLDDRVESRPLWAHAAYVIPIGIPNK